MVNAGDPRLALDKLLHQQLKLLMEIRSIWRRADKSRGALPHIPSLPPIPKLSNIQNWSEAAALQQLMQPAHARSEEGLHSPDGSTRDGATSDDGAAAACDDERRAPVGAYLDGGVHGGSEHDAGSSLGPAHHDLPERLSDL